jgi:Membrane bound beta barrel domain (DUF5777)
MKKTLLIVLLSLLVCAGTKAQDDSSVKKKEKGEPVTGEFENGTLIDAQTSVINDVKTLEFTIQHKFGSVENGISDLYGIYSAGANVRLGLDYVPYKNVQVGVGITKSGMNTDLNAKWTIFEQTKNNSVPVFVMVYGNVAINGQSESDLLQGGIGLNNYGNVNALYSLKFSHRLSYFSQLIVGRKFDDHFTLQGGISFAHANIVAQYHDHDVIGLHLAGRYKFSPQSSIIATYDAPLNIQSISEQNPDWTAENAPGWDGPYHPKPILKFGIEISTFTHAFQIYVGNAGGILPQIDMMNNTNKSFDGLALGFTITRLWMF